MITKEQAIEILDFFDFFQGQRAGRELWSEKPFDVQEEDIANFARDVELLKEYITTADVVPKSESLPLDVHEALKQRAVEKAKADVAREIFAELETKAPWFCENQTAYEHFNEELAELKKKYQEGEPNG